MISVALCTCNGEKYIYEQLESIFMQSIMPDEVIICDDCSDDKTVSVINRFIEEHNVCIRLIKNKYRLGVTKNFEQALLYCKGDVIFLSDQDDIWENDKVAEIIKAFKKFPICNAVFANAELIDAKGHDLGDSLWNNIKFKQQKYSYNIEDFIGKRFVTGATLAVKKAFINSITPFPEEWLHDGWIAINASLTSSIYSVDKKLIKYRQHDSNVLGAEHESFLCKVIRRVNAPSQTIEDKKKMYGRFKKVYEKNLENLTYEQAKIIRDCIRFWETMLNMYGVSKCKGLFIIIKNVYNGNYKKYHTGLKGALNDIYSIVQRR